MPLEGLRTDNSPRASLNAGTCIDLAPRDIEHGTTINNTESGYKALHTMFAYKDHRPDALRMQKLVEVFSRNVDEWQALCTLQAVTTDNELVKFIFEDNVLEMSRREAITADIARRQTPQQSNQSILRLSIGLISLRRRC